MEINELYYGFDPYTKAQRLIEAKEKPKDASNNTQQESEETNDASIATLGADSNPKNWEESFTEFISSGNFEKTLDGLEIDEDIIDNELTATKTDSSVNANIDSSVNANINNTKEMQQIFNEYI